jgi:hypothetical protein
VWRKPADPDLRASYGIMVAVIAGASLWAIIAAVVWLVW